MRQSKAVGLLAFVWGGLCCLGCNPSPDRFRSVPTEQPISVVATYSILADFVKRVGGDRVEVTTLVGVDGDPHTYEPAPKDSVAISNAFLIFENGLHFESWLDKLHQSSRSQAERVVVTREITPRSHKCACHGTEQDPHVWHSIKHAISMVGVIAQELSRIDPDSASGYRQRAEEYIGQLQALDDEIRRQVNALPEERRKLVTAHNSFGYFADEYGFQAYSLMDSVTSEASDPSAMRLASIVRQVKESNVPAIFSENTINGDLTEVVAREAGVDWIGGLYTDALGSAESPASDYLGMMRHNAKTILESLSR
jgi:zinc/manganese transport system substrate-binding protein